MALNASGAISLGGSTVGESINLELNKSATATITMNDSDVRTLGGISSGAIDLNTFHSKSNVPPFFGSTVTQGSTGDYSNMTLWDALSSSVSGSTVVLMSREYQPQTMFLCRLSSTGTHTWTVKLTGGGWSQYPVGNTTRIYEDGSANIYCVFGSYASSPTTVMVIKFDSSGSLLWGRRFAGSSVNFGNSGTASAVDSSGNVYFSIETTDAAHVVAKIDSSGTVSWCKKITSVFVYSSGSSGGYVDSSGNYYALCHGYVSSITVANWRDITYKLNSTGSVVSAKAPYYAGGSGLGYTRTNGATPVYYSNGSVMYTLVETSVYDIHVALFNSNDTAAWHKSTPGSLNSSGQNGQIIPLGNNSVFHTKWGAVLDPSGTLAATGSSFNGSAVSGKAAGQKSVYYHSLQNQAFVVRYPVDGSLVGMVQLDSASSSYFLISAGTSYTPTANTDAISLVNFTPSVADFTLTATAAANNIAFTAYSPVTTGNANAVPFTATSLTGLSTVSAVYTTPGTYTWVVPSGVTAVTAVAIAGAPGGGGGMQPGPTGGNTAYRNNWPVTPGASHTVFVGAGGTGKPNGQAADPGQASWFSNTVSGVSTTSNSQTPQLAPGRPGQSYGGGGAGGYGNSSLQYGYGGPGGINGNHPYYQRGWGGGGVGIGGAGIVGVTGGPGSIANSGSGGSGGTAGVFNGGEFGGAGAAGGSTYCPYCPYFSQPPTVTYHTGGNGGKGAVRILYPGSTRSFPNTNTGTL